MTLSERLVSAPAILTSGKKLCDILTNRAIFLRRDASETSDHNDRKTLRHLFISFLYDGFLKLMPRQVDESLESWTGSLCRVSEGIALQKIGLAEHRP
jgi:hypothetical protein